MLLLYFFYAVPGLPVPSEVEGIRDLTSKKMERMFYVYILASKKDGVLYTGMTNNLVERIHAHRLKMFSKFTSKYHVTKLVYFEEIDNVYDAYSRERRIKNWKRQWKIDLLENFNPEWKDLYNDLI